MKARKTKERGLCKMKTKWKKEEEGITLIALVITIIVLLILAGISIVTLTGENGILSKAETAKNQTEIEDAKEQAKLDIASWIADKLEKGENADLDDSIVKTILTTGEKEYVKEAKETSFTTKNSGYEIPYSELYQKGKVKFTITANNSSHGGTFEVESGTTWYDFFHEKFPNDDDAWVYLTHDGTIVGDIIYSGMTYALGSFLRNNQDGYIYKDDVIISRNLSYFFTYGGVFVFR